MQEEYLNNNTFNKDLLLEEPIFLSKIWKLVPAHGEN